MYDTHHLIFLTILTVSNWILHFLSKVLLVLRTDDVLNATEPSTTTSNSNDVSPKTLFAENAMTKIDAFLVILAMWLSMTFASSTTEEFLLLCLHQLLVHLLLRVEAPKVMLIWQSVLLSAGYSRKTYASNVLLATIQVKDSVILLVTNAMLTTKQQENA